VNLKKLEVKAMNNEVIIRFKEPEPIPIFSCLYCTNEHLVFSHMGNTLLAKKYEGLLRESFKKAEEDLLSLSEVQPVERHEFEGARMGNPKLSKSGTNISNMKRYQRYLTNKESKLNQIKSKLELVLNDTIKIPCTQHVADKNSYWILQKFYLSRKNRPKLSFLIERSVSITGNAPQRSFQKKEPSGNSNVCFKSSCVQSFEGSLASNKPTEDLNFSISEHNIYSPTFDLENSLDHSFIEEELEKTRALTIKPRSDEVKNVPVLSFKKEEQVKSKEASRASYGEVTKHKQSYSISSLLNSNKKPPLQSNTLRRKYYSKVPKKMPEQKTQRVLIKTIKDESGVEIERIKEYNNCRSLIAKNKDGVSIQIMITSVIERRKPRTSNKPKHIGFNNTQKISLLDSKKLESRSNVPRYLQSDLFSPKNHLHMKTYRKHP
jgi:hypothetical protein